MERLKQGQTNKELLAENQELRRLLDEAEQTLEAIRSGEVDAVLVTGPQGDQVYTLTGAEQVYGLIVETMQEAAVTADPAGTILFANAQFGHLVKRPMDQVVGRRLHDYVPDDQRQAVDMLLADSWQGTVRRRLVFESADGAQFPVYLASSLLDQPGGQSICLVGTDLTELENSTELVQQLRRQEKALREAEERFRLALKNSSVLVAMQDANLVYRWAYNTQTRRPEDIVGKTDADLFAAEEADALLEVKRQVLHTGQVARHEHWFTSDGQRVFLDIYVEPVRDPAGRVSGVAIAAVNLTEQKKAEEALRQSEARLRTTLRGTTDEIWIVDAQGRIISLSDSVRESLGVSSDRWVDIEAALDQLEVFRPDGSRRPKEHAILPRALRGEVIRNEEEIIRHLATGQLRWREASGTPIRDENGRIIGAVAVARDVTDRKQADADLRQAKADLEQKVQDRTAQLTQRAAQLRALAGELTLSEQRERRRMGKLLHDHLQQLLVGAKFRTTLLRRDGDQTIRQAAAEIEHLLDESIRASRSLTAELSPPILHEGGLIPGLEWLQRWMADKHKLVVHLTGDAELPPLAEDMKVLLFESVRELLFNSVKHARVPSVKVDVRRIGSDEVRVTVSDEGLGFDPTKMSPVGETVAGLGLFSIRERLDLMGGRMTVDSAPGRGSRFELIVPAREVTAAPVAELAPAIKAAVQQAVRANTQPKVGAAIRVLLADDHEVMREGLTRLLDAEPDMVIVGQAKDGQEAVELAGDLLPDVVLMDMSMPRMTGEEATRAIHAEHPEIRIIGLSMFEEADRADALRHAGASAYLTKSGPSSDLIAAIRRCVESGHPLSAGSER